MNNQAPELSGFLRYLMAKKTVDDRALNKDVYHHLRYNLSLPGTRRILEVGAGIGTMVQRLFETLTTFDLDYTLMDVEAQNLAAVFDVLTHFAQAQSIQVEVIDDQQLSLWAAGKICRISLVEADLMQLSTLDLPPWDGVIAHAVLDLVNLDLVLPIIRGCLNPGGWLYSTINFDGLTLLEPVVDPSLDHSIINAYHNSMDQRLVDGELSAGSSSGRRLFHALRKHQYQIQAAGASDWFVFANEGLYPFDEAFFLNCILDFFEDSVGKSGVIESSLFQGWLEQRRNQVKTGDLMLITHQYDYFAVRSE